MNFNPIFAVFLYQLLPAAPPAPPPPPPPTSKPNFVRPGSRGAFANLGAKPWLFAPHCFLLEIKTWLNRNLQEKTSRLARWPRTGKTYRILLVFFSILYIPLLHINPRTETVRSGAIKVNRLTFCLLNQSCFDQLSGDNIQKRWFYEGPFNLRQC